MFFLVNIFFINFDNKLFFQTFVATNYFFPRENNLFFGDQRPTIFYVSSKNFFVVRFPYYVRYHFVFFLVNIFFINFDNKLFFLTFVATNYFFQFLLAQPPPPRISNGASLTSMSHDVTIIFEKIENPQFTPLAA